MRFIHKGCPNRIKHQPTHHRKYPHIHTQRSPILAMQNPPRLDVSNDPLHHRTQPINHTIVTLNSNRCLTARLTLGSSEQPQANIALISQRSFIQILL